MIEGQEGVTWEQWIALARACEEHGIDTLFRSDHYISFGSPAEKGSLDAWATIAGLAAGTTTLRLGTLVSPVTFRHPSLLAKAVATADHISGGRVELGMGAGWMEPEHRAYGFPFPPMSERLEMLSEQIEIVHRQWTEESFDFHGSHYDLEGCTALPKPRQSPHPPLIVGGKGKAGTVGPAVRFADEYNAVMVAPDEFAAIRQRVGAACESEGRDPDTMRFSLMTPLAGSLDEIAARIREYEDAGCERIMLQHLQHDDLDTVARYGRELAPLVS